MKKLSPQDIWPAQVYEGVRDEFRRKVIAHKKIRRVSVGPFMTFVFEDRITVKFQIQEILRAERITRPEDIAEEVNAFNEMIPDAGELSATLLIESASEAEAKERLASLVGLRESVWIEVGGHRIQARFDPNREDDRRVSAVQYLRFPFSKEAREAFQKEEEEARLIVEHPNYRHSLRIEGDLRLSLKSDLQEE